MFEGSIRCSLGELCESLRLTPRAIRYYEERGLIESSRDGRNRRRYDARARWRLQLIAILRRALLPLPQVELILECEDGQARQLELAASALAAHRQTYERLCRDVDVNLAELTRLAPRPRPSLVRPEVRQAATG